MPDGVKDRTLEVQMAVGLENTRRKQKFMQILRRKKSKEDNGNNNVNETFPEQANGIREQIRVLQALCITIKTESDGLSSSPFQVNERKSSLEENTTKFKSISKGIHSQLKEIGKHIHNNELSLSTSSTQQRIQEIQYNALAKEFNTVKNELQLHLSEHGDKCLQNIAKRLKIAGSTKSPEEIESIMESGNTNWSIFTDGILIESQRARDELNQIQDRYNFILQIEKSVEELNAMFVQLGHCVQEQGDTIDSIQRNVEAAAEYTTKSEKGLKDVGKSKRKWRKRKIILASGAAAITAIVISVIVI